MKQHSRPRLVMRHRQTTKLKQRYLYAAGAFAALIFAISFVYWNFGINTDTHAAAVSYTWNGSVDSLFTTSSNWTPAGVPTSIDNITIGTTARYPALTSNQSVANITMNNNARLNINGKTLTVTGNAAFNGGNLADFAGGGSVSTSGTSTTFGTTTTTMIITPDLTVNSSTITMTKTTFNGQTNITKTGTTNDASAGDNIFNAAVSLNNSGTGYFLFANTTRDIYNADVTFNSSNSGIIYPAYKGTNTQFNQNIIINSTGTGGIRIGANTGTSTLASGKSIINGSSGFSSGMIQFANFTPAGTAAMSFTSTGSGVLTLGPATTFNCDVTVNCSGVCLNGATFNGLADITKNGSGNEQGTGNNVFNGVTSLTNTGTGYLLFSNTTRDIYNSDVTFSITNTGLMYIAYAGVGTQFNQNVILNNTSTGGFRFGSNNGTSVLASTKTLSIGSSGFTGGTLQLGGFSLSNNENFSITLPSAVQLTVGPNSTFGGTFTANCGGICLSGATFNGAVDITKTGAMNDGGNGNNTFNSTVNITNNGTGYLMSSNSTRDIYNGDATFSSNSSGIIYLAYNGSGTQFNQNVYVNSLSSGGVRIGQNNGTSTLAVGKTISAGSSGFSSGMLLLGNFTPAGTNPFSISLPSTATLTLGPATTFNGDFTANCGGIALSGVTFNAAAYITKTGASNDGGNGNNTFNGTMSITNSGSGYLMTSNITRDIYNTDANFISTGSGIIYIAYNGTGTQFNQNVNVTSTGTGGVRIGSANGTSVLADTKTINIGAGGFSGGMLQLGNFSPAGSTAQNITLTGTGVLTLGPGSSFAGDVTATCGGLCLSGTTFNGTTTLIKNGTTNDAGVGNNTFNGPTSITNNGTGYLLMSNNARDIFNTDAVINATNSGAVYLAYNGVNTQFNQNMVFSSSGTGGIRVGASTGTTTLADGKRILVGGGGFTAGQIQLTNFSTTGTTAQSISGAGSLIVGPATTFTSDFTANCGGLSLNGATFNGTCTLTKTGATNDAGNGNNVFNGTTAISHSGTGYLILGNITRDIFNAPVTFSSSGSGFLYPAYNSAGTQFNETVSFNISSTGGIRFGWAGGTSTLLTGKTIGVGGSGISNGELTFKNFTQSGSTAQSLSVSSGTAALYLSTSTVFNGDINFTFPQLFLNGATFNGIATLEKSGATNNTSSGGNVFNAAATIKNSSTGNFLLGNSSADDFNANATFIQTGSGNLTPSYNSNSTFAGDISTAGSTAIVSFATAAGGTVTLNGTSLQNINGSATYPPTIARLAVNNGSNGLTLNVPITVSSALTLTSGNINTTSSNYLAIGNALTTVSGVSDASYVNGPVRKIGNNAFTFPIGKNGHYRPISISAPTVATDHFTAEYFNADPNASYPAANHIGTLNHVSRCEYWTLNRTNGASNVSVTGSWNGTSCGVSNLTDLRVARWDVATSRWVDLGNSLTTGDTTSGTVKSSGTTSSFGAFTLGSATSSNALPVELVSFAVKKEGEQVIARWITASEKNNDYFTVEKSIDGKVFDKVGKVRGVGNSSVQNSYELIDDNPLTGASYYRLKQTDFDGKSETFRVVMLDIASTGEVFKINSVGPNPFSDNLHVQCKSDQDVEVSIELINTAGMMMYEEKRMLYSGSNDLDLSSFSDLKPGIYFMKLVKEGKETEPVKLIKN